MSYFPVILSTFPGAFKLSELRRMDVRDLDLWYREALKIKLESTLEGIQKVRFGMGGKDAYVNIVNSIKEQLRKLRLGARNAQLSNLEKLKDVQRKRSKNKKV